MSRQNDPSIQALARLAEIVQNRKDFGEVLSYIETNLSKLLSDEIAPTLWKILQSTPAEYTTQGLRICLGILKPIGERQRTARSEYETILRQNSSPHRLLPSEWPPQPSAALQAALYPPPNPIKQIELIAIRLLDPRRAPGGSISDAVRTGTEIARLINSSNYHRRINILKSCFSLVKESKNLDRLEKAALYDHVSLACSDAWLFIEKDRPVVPVYSEGGSYGHGVMGGISGGDIRGYELNGPLTRSQRFHKMRLGWLKEKILRHIVQCRAPEIKEAEARKAQEAAAHSAKEAEQIAAATARKNMVQKLTSGISASLRRAARR
jgi:hypothetical protein